MKVKVLKRPVKVGDKVRYKRSWEAKNFGYNDRPDIRIGDILELIEIEPNGRMVLESQTGFLHRSWNFEEDWHEVVIEIPLTKEELDRAVPLPSYDVLKQFLDKMP